MSTLVASKIVAEVQADTKDAEQNLKNVGAAANEGSSGIKGLLGHALAIAGGIGVVAAVGTAFGFVTDQIGDSVAVAKQAEQTQALLANAIKDTNGATGQTLQGLEDMAEHLSTVTTYSKDTVEGVERIAVRARIPKGLFDQTTQEALDLAQSLGISAPDAANLLTKALDNTQQAVSILKREHINLTQAQQDAIKADNARGDSLSAQQVILGAVKDAYGGAAQAAGDTFGGALQIAQNQLENTKEKIGTALMPILADLLSALTPVITAVGNFLPIALSAVSQFISDHVLPAVKLLSDWIRTEGVPLFMQFVAFVQANVVPALQSLSEFVISKVLPAIVSLSQWFVTNVLPVLENLANIIVTEVFPAIASLVSVILSDVLPALQQLWNVVSPVLLPALSILGWLLGNVIGPAADILAHAVAGVITVLADLIGIIGGLLGAFGFIKDKIGDFLGMLGDVNTFLGVTFTNTLNAIPGLLGAAFGGLWGIVKVPLNLMIDGINALISGLDTIQVKVPDWSPIGGGQTFGINIPKIPHLATGGEIAMGGLAMVGEDGPEPVILPTGARVIPNSQAHNLFSGSTSGDKGYRTANVTVAIDSQTIIQALMQPLHDEIRLATGLAM